MNGKKALVTGSSRGIGRAIAIKLAKDGYRVIVHYAGNDDKAIETKEIIESNGGKAQLIKTDFCNIDAVKELAEKVNNIDVLVLNASVQYRNKWENITLKECADQINCNFVASLLLIQSVVPNMKNKRWGRIVTIGSVQEAKPHPDMLVYSATKSAQTNMVKSLALQLAPFGITVNNIAPGVIYTDRNVEALSDPEYAKKVTNTIPLGFYGIPEDCAGIVSFICSEEGRYITGQNIFVDGGKSVQ